MIKNKKTAFTLAETLVTVVILGIVAAILVQNLINRQVENANRTKVKKAMAAYEKAINFIILENDIKSTEELKEFGEEENCKFSKSYFKTVQDGANDCIFKTADRVWWDITDLTNPLISLKDEITSSNEATIATNALNLNADTTSFALIGRFDDLGTLRVNDNAYEQGLDDNLINQAYMIKLWHFINNNGEFNTKEQFAVCKATRANSCKITVNGKSTNYTRINTTEDIEKGPYSIYDRNSDSHIISNYTSSAPKGEYWISDNLGKLTANEAKDLTGSICISWGCINNGDYYEATKRKCAEQGAHLANIAELNIAYENGKLTGNGYYFASEESNYPSERERTYCLNINGNLGYNCAKNNSSNKGICVFDN